MSKVKKLSLRDLLYTIFRHQRKIIFVCSTILLASAIWTYFAPHIYEAHCKVLINIKNKGQSPHFINERHGLIASQMEVLRSWYSIEKLINHIELDRLSSNISFDETVREVQKNLMLASKDGFDMSIVDIGFRWKDPTMCAEVVNTLADLYIESLKPGGFDILPDQLELHKERLRKSERKLHQFKQKWDIDSIDSRRLHISNTLAKLKKSLQDTDREIKKVEQTISQFNTSHPAPGSPGDSPPGDALIAQIDLSALKIKKDSLTTQIRSLNDQIERYNEMMVEFDKLASKVKIDKEALLKYTKKIEQTKVHEGMDERNIINASIIESASIPLRPIKPRWDLNLMLAIIAGLTAGIGVAFISEYLDHSFRDEEDVKQYLDLSVLASIPEKKRDISDERRNI